VITFQLITLQAVFLAISTFAHSCLATWRVESVRYRASSQSVRCESEDCWLSQSAALCQHCSSAPCHPTSFCPKYLGKVKDRAGKAGRLAIFLAPTPCVVIAAETKMCVLPLPKPRRFSWGPQRLHGILGCATGHKLWGVWPINSGIALASGESTAASLPNYAWTIVFQVWKHCKTNETQGLRSSRPFYVDANSIRLILFRCLPDVCAHQNATLWHVRGYHNQKTGAQDQHP